MRSRILPIILVLLSGIFFVSCSKQNDVIADESALIGTWSVVGISSNAPYDWDGDGYTETDIYSTYSSCERDIVLAFDNNGYGQTRQGCTSYWQNFNWQLNGRMLSINLPSDDLNLNLVQFDSYTIRGEDQVYVNGRSFIITYTLARR